MSSTSTPGSIAFLINVACNPCVGDDSRLPNYGRRAAEELKELEASIAGKAEMLAALKAVEPFLPTLDDGPVRHSAHGQAAGLVRAAIAKAEGRS